MMGRGGERGCLLPERGPLPLCHLDPTPLLLGAEAGAITSRLGAPEGRGGGWPPTPSNTTPIGGGSRRRTMPTTLFLAEPRVRPWPYLLRTRALRVGPSLVIAVQVPFGGNRPQPLCQPPPTACLTACGTTSKVLMHPCPPLSQRPVPEAEHARPHEEGIEFARGFLVGPKSRPMPPPP